MSALGWQPASQNSRNWNVNFFAGQPSAFHSTQPSYSDMDYMNALTVPTTSNSGDSQSCRALSLGAGRETESVLLTQNTWLLSVVKPDTAKQVCKTGVAAKGIKERMNLEP